MAPAVLILAGAFLAATAVAAHTAEPIKQVRGAHGFICRTVEAAVEFNQATALLSDEAFDVFVEADESIPCAFGVIDGALVKVERTFLRLDQRVVQVWQYRPAAQLTTKLYVFVAVPVDEDVGL